MMHHPLQITAHLAGSIAITRPEDLSLDGILATQVLRRHFGEGFYSLPNPKETLIFARLPLAIRGEQPGYQTGDVWQTPEQEYWYYACSTAQIRVAGRDRQYWNKRFDTAPGLSDHIDFNGRVEKVIIEQGQFKAYHMPLTTLVTDRVMWYAVGDRAEIASLLVSVSAIGKKRVQGQGYVVRWSVEDVVEDWSEWKHGQLLRPIPGPAFAAQYSQYTPLSMQYIAFRSPQWHTVNQCMCVTSAVLS